MRDQTSEIPQSVGTHGDRSPQRPVQTASPQTLADVRGVQRVTSSERTPQQIVGSEFLEKLKGLGYVVARLGTWQKNAERAVWDHYESAELDQKNYQYWLYKGDLLLDPVLLLTNSARARDSSNDIEIYFMPEDLAALEKREMLKGKLVSRNMKLKRARLEWSGPTTKLQFRLMSIITDN